MEMSGTNMCKAVDIEGVAVKATFESRVCVGDSDDSDTEGGLGNVERVVMRPPGHSGKAKRGHLCFDSCFETGNLGRVDFITENEYDLFVRPDTCNPRARFWFHFSVSNVQRGQRVLFNVVNLGRSRSLFRSGMTPVVKSTSRPKWQRLKPSQVYFYTSPEHSNNTVLSMAFAFDHEEGEVYSFALTFPYSYSRCNALVKRLSRRKGPELEEEENGQDDGDLDIPKEPKRRTREIIRVETLAKSVHGLNAPLVTITDDVEGDVNGKNLVIVLTRSHPCDSATSFIVQGMMEFLTSDHGIAQEVRNKIVFKVVPMMNPDGVFLGNTRSTLVGADLNRSWNDISAFKHPVLHAANQLIMESSEKHTLDFVIDLHAHSNLNGIFVQGNSYDSVFRFERHIVFPKMLAQNCSDFHTANTVYNGDLEKEGTARRALCVQIGDKTNVYSLEVSMNGREVPASPEQLKLLPDDKFTVEPYTVEDYSLHGRRIVRALWDYYKINGVIESTYSSRKKREDQEGPGEASFSMLKLREISRQRDLFSSVESITTSDESWDSDDDSWARRRRERRRLGQGISPRGEGTDEDIGDLGFTTKAIGNLGRSSSSHVREFISEDNKDTRFDFLAYSRSIRGTATSTVDKEPIKVVGKNILPKDSSREEEDGDGEKTMQKVEEEPQQQQQSFQWQVANPREVTFFPPTTSPVRTTPATTPRRKCKPLTISTLRLMPVCLDDTNDMTAGLEHEASSGYRHRSNRQQHYLSQPELFKASETKSLRVVGGGGVISKSERLRAGRHVRRRSSLDSSGYVGGMGNNQRETLDWWQQTGGGGGAGVGRSLHAEIRLDQLTSFRKIRTRRSEQKRAKRRLRKSATRHACKSASPRRRRARGDEDEPPSPVSGAQITVAVKKDKKKARRRLTAAAGGGGVGTPPTCLSEDQLLELQLQTVADSSNLSPENRKDRKAKKKRLRKAKAVIDLDI